jgi:hypothetical protein
MRGLGSKHLAACRAFAFLVVRPENSKYIFLSLSYSKLCSFRSARNPSMHPAHQLSCSNSALTRTRKRYVLRSPALAAGFSR